jgi:hypothetical protein
MRIGEVNEDNYKIYQQLLDIKNTKSLDDDENKLEKDFSFEARAADIYASGYGIEGMMVREGDPTGHHKMVPVPDWIKKAVIDCEREIFIKNANGTGGTEDGNRVAAIIIDYIKTIPPDERLSTAWTLQQVWGPEARRMEAHLREIVPDWKPGQSFDRNIFANWEPGYGSDENHLDIIA